MSESVYFVHTTQPSELLAKVHNTLADHLDLRGLTVVEYQPSVTGDDDIASGQWGDLKNSLAVIAELTEADAAVRLPLAAAIHFDRPILTLFNRYAADPGKPETDVSDLIVTSSYRCSRLYMAKIMTDIFLETHAQYPMTTQRQY
jgi:hypothetical protein